MFLSTNTYGAVGGSIVQKTNKNNGSDNNGKTNKEGIFKSVARNPLVERLIVLTISTNSTNRSDDDDDNTESNGNESNRLH